VDRAAWLDPAHAARFRSVQRLDHLDDLLDHRASADDIALSMLQKPLYSHEFSQSFGTLFTADYRPAEQSVTYHWPELSWTRTFDSPDATVDVVLADA
jgi:predicted choloylglycine hydrolase